MPKVNARIYEDNAGMEKRGHMNRIAAPLVALALLGLAGCAQTPEQAIDQGCAETQDQTRLGQGR